MSFSSSRKSCSLSKEEKHAHNHVHMKAIMFVCLLLRHTYVHLKCKLLSLVSVGFLWISRKHLTLLTIIFYWVNLIIMVCVVLQINDLKLIYVKEKYLCKRKECVSGNGFKSNTSTLTCGVFVYVYVFFILIWHEIALYTNTV